MDQNNMFPDYQSEINIIGETLGVTCPIVKNKDGITRIDVSELSLMLMELYPRYRESGDSLIAFVTSRFGKNTSELIDKWSV